jgi:hypothetical protein
MSFDVIVWLGCAVALPQALPEAHTWTHYRSSMPNLDGLPPSIAEQFRDIESWQLVRESHLINASYASKTRLTFDDLRLIAPSISVRTVGAPTSSAETSPDTGGDTRKVELEARARDAKLGVSLVLEGVSDDGVNELIAMAGHLARACGGAVLEAPTGFHELDTSGQVVE